MKWLYPKAKGFVFQTNEQKKYFNEEIQKKSVIIFNPIKESFLENSNIKLEERENTIITIGRLVPQKNQEMLVEAFEKISKEYPEYKLKIFGTGPLKEELQEKINNLNMKDKIFLCGLTDNIKEELEKSKIFVLSSDYEGMPNSLIEAMAVGCTVISTDCPCGGPKELIKNGSNGILISVNNENELQNSLKDLFENKDKMEVLSKNAKRIVEALKEEKIIEQWKRYIDKVLKKENYSE